MFACERVCLGGRECFAEACVVCLLPYLITACKKAITSHWIATLCTLHGGSEMESSFSYLSLSVSVLHFRTNSTDMELCHSDRVCVCAQHCWCLQQLCMSLCISTTSYSPVKVCNDSGLLGCVSHVEVIVASCCCLYAPHSCLNLY